MKRYFTLPLLAFVLLPTAIAQAPKSAIQPPAAAPKFGSYETVTGSRLKAHLEFIASDLLEGRDTPSRGLDIAAAYIAAQLKLWGVQPGGDNGTYFQKVTINVDNQPRVYSNVVGIVPGSDPVLKSEYVAFGAHYDHVGVNGEGPGDHIWNGADDDGSGTVAVLEIAHAFATGQKPKRSLIFVWHAGEEKGLWGSKHFVDNPTVPIDKIIAQLNIDMIGRSRAEGDTSNANKNLTDANSIYVIGSKMLSDDLGNAVANVNKDLLKMNLDYKYDDPKDPEQFYYRSDHFNYASKGIPIAFFFSGVHEDYHQPSDEVSKIDFQKMERVSRTVYSIGWSLAQAPTRPKLNKPKGP